VSGKDLKQLVSSCLESVGLPGFEDREPHRLSQGEKRRVVLLGSGVQTAVLVLDEPTSDLDPRGRREFKTLLRSIPGAKLIATHDLELAVDICSSAILLDQGTLIRSGPAVELLSDEALMLAHGLEKPHSLTHRHPHGPARRS